MFHIALFQPEIPPNTGNIIRLCANTGVVLHLIKPLGFELDDKRLKRAGLDYHEFANIKTYDNYQIFKEQVKENRVFACSTKGKMCYADTRFSSGDIFLFGPETRGLPKEILNESPQNQIIRIPMLPNSRSLNLSNAVAIILFEALRQINFSLAGCAQTEA